MNATESYGFSPKEIGLMTLKELEPYDYAYQRKEKQKYEFLKVSAWEHGIYTLYAINSSSLGNSSLFRGNNEIVRYPSTPDMEDETDNSEVNEIRAVMEMKRACRKWGEQLEEAPK